VEAFARRIADTPGPRCDPHDREGARDKHASTKLSAATAKAYATLFKESGLGAGDAGGPPGADQERFDPAVIIEDYAAGNVQGSTQLLGFTDTVRDAILSPLRQLSFWKMNDRARVFGGPTPRPSAKLQATALTQIFSWDTASAHRRLGDRCGRCRSPPLPRPVDSLFLVRAPCRCERTPGHPARGTLFHRILSKRLVRGPIVTTRSVRHRGWTFYPMGADQAATRARRGRVSSTAASGRSA
jgi:hypothetical protein